MLAAAIFISPAGPMVMTPILPPRRLFKGLDDGEIALADQLRFFADGDAGGGDLQAVPVVPCGWPSMIRALTPSWPASGPTVPPALASLMVPVSGLLAPKERRPELAARVPESRPGAKTSLLCGAEGMAGRFDLGGDDGGGQAAAAESHPFGRDLFDPQRQIGHVDTKNFVSHCFSSISPLGDSLAACEQRNGASIGPRRCPGGHPHGSDRITGPPYRSP